MFTVLRSYSNFQILTKLKLFTYITVLYILKILKVNAIEPMTS